MHRRSLLIAPALLSGGRSSAAGGAPRVVVELFTSQSCSSCPPADALLAELVVRRPDVLALSLHVTYWNRLGWRDPFSLPAATERQRRYAATLRHGEVYTPQLVVQGTRDVVGSDRAAVAAAIAAAPPLRVPILAEAAATEVAISLAPGAGEAALWIAGFDARHNTQVTAGENGGRQLTHIHVVRELRQVDRPSSDSGRIMTARPAGTQVAVLLQARDGSLIGAAVAP